MHGLISTYNYLISSCAYPEWALHRFSMWMYEYEYGYDAMPFSVAVVLLASHVTLGPG